MGLPSVLSAASNELDPTQTKTTVMLRLTWSEWPSFKRLQITNVGEGAEERNPPLVGVYVGAATMENSMEVPQKTKNRITLGSRTPTPRHISRQNYHLKRYTHLNVHSSTSRNSQDMGAS